MSFLLKVSICLECNSSKLRGLKRKWIRCSAQATVLHLKKFIAKKLNLSSFNEVIVGTISRNCSKSFPVCKRDASQVFGFIFLCLTVLEILNQKKSQFVLLSLQIV